MTPFEFFQWCVAAALGLVVVAFALCLAIVLIRSALNVRPRA